MRPTQLAGRLSHAESRPLCNKNKPTLKPSSKTATLANINVDLPTLIMLHPFNQASFHAAESNGSRLL
jgi:hypothetical protein